LVLDQHIDEDFASTAEASPAGGSAEDEVRLNVSKVPGDEVTRLGNHSVEVNKVNELRTDEA
jgi:hypothetical protein